MTHDPATRAQCGHAPSTPRPWTAPVLEVLPELKALTLQSPIWGGEGGFGFLDTSGPTRRLG